MSDNPYYPVTTSSDTAQLAEDEWGLSMPGVQYVRKVTRTKRAQAIVDGCQSIPRCAIIIFVSVMVLVLVCVIIAMAADQSGEGKPSETEPARFHTAQGLNFYPIPGDKSILIRYLPHKFRNDEAIKKTMDEALEQYEHFHQIGNKEYVHCTETYAPANETCRFFMSQFGDECIPSRDYGYSMNMPCVLLQLDLPGNKTMQRITESSKLWNKAKDVPAVIKSETDTSVIPFSCDGTTPEDKKILNIGDPVPTSGERIRYFPSTNLPSYFYRPRDLSMPFIKPAVMIQLTSLVDLQLLHLTCTVWGQVYSADGVMENHDLLTTTFAIYIDED